MRKTVSILAVLLFAVACKKTETATSSTTSSTQATSTSATVAPTPQPTATTATTTSAPAPAGNVIAATEGEKPGARIDITELKRTSGGTLNLKFTVANGGSEKLGLYGAYLGDASVSHDHYRDVSGVHLLDPVNKKKYFVVTDAEKHCVCSKEIPDLEPGGKVNLWAKFPAPPPEVTKVTIEIPHFTPIDDVTISQ
ncbi:MAG TPA: hypothetical protein VII12_16835 [Thermoanaerobaculia bacterium]|jgi:hypothetical protein